MNPNHAAEVRAWMRMAGFAPSKSLGQNFLVDVHQRDFLLEAANPAPSDAVLEIGPGLGVLTGPLLDACARVVAIELDRRLAEHLRREYAGRRNFTLIEGDALRQDLSALLEEGVNKVVSNLPYSAGSRILFALAESPRRPECMVVTVQREVADRLAAPVDGGEYGLLSVWMQTFYEVALLRGVPSGSFLPPPRVESAVVRLVRRPEPAGGAEPDRLAPVLKRAFEHRRKQLGTIFRKAPAPSFIDPERMREAGIDPRLRPETLSPEQFAILSRLAPPHASHRPY